MLKLEIMSREEQHKGKVSKVIVPPDFQGTFDEECQWLWAVEGRNSEDYYEGCLFDEFYKKYLHTNTEIWQILENEEFDEDGYYCNLTDNEDGTYSYITRFYNDGTDIIEMLAEELNNVK